MAQDKKVAATGQYNAALLNLDYNQEIVNLNHAIDRVNQTRAEAEEDIGFWEGVGQVVEPTIRTGLDKAFNIDKKQTDMVLAKQ